MNEQVRGISRGGVFRIEHPQRRRPIERPGLHPKPPGQPQPPHEQDLVRALRTQELLPCAAREVAAHPQPPRVPRRSQQHGHARLVCLLPLENEKRLGQVPGRERDHPQPGAADFGVVLLREVDDLLKISEQESGKLLCDLCPEYEFNEEGAGPKGQSWIYNKEHENSSAG